MEAITLRVRGEGGAESDLDLPPLGTPQREVFDDMVAKGQWVVLDGDYPPGLAEPTPGAAFDPDAVPEGNIATVTAWVRGGPDDVEPADGWQDRAARALAVERDGDQRSSLIKLLEGLAEPTPGAA